MSCVPISSVRELRSALAAQRSQAIAQVRRSELALWSLFERFGACCEGLLEQFDKTPERTADEYREARNTMLVRIDSNESLRGFIREGKTSDRLVEGGYFRSKVDIARKVIGKHRRMGGDASRSKSSLDLMDHAVGILDNEIQEIERRINALDVAWNALTSRALALLKCIGKLGQAGLASIENRALADLEALLVLLHSEGTHRGRGADRRRSARLRVMASLRTIPLRHFLIETMNAAAIAIVGRLPQAAEEVKRGILHDKSRMLITQLVLWQEPPRFTSLEQAISGLHFTFISARRGVGSLSAKDQARLRKKLDNASDEDVLHALMSLVERRVLPANELDVFQYTESLWSAVQAVERRQIDVANARSCRTDVGRMSVAM